MASSLSVEQGARPRSLPGRLPAGQLSRRAGYLGTILLACTLMAVWLLSGVPIGDASRFIAFEVLYVLFPGCMIYLSLSARPGSWLGILALGWPLGYALEIGGFALTAELHVRGAFTFLPLAVAITLGPCIAYRRHRIRSAPSAPLMSRDGLTGGRERGAESLIATIAIAIALVLLAFRFFATYPLPEHARSVFYFLDNVEYVSIAAEALHHWPIAEPFLAGHSFRYYTGVFMHIAAIKQVMGVPLAMTVFRLLPATLTLVAALQFWCLGGLLSRSRWAGPLTVALLLAVENIKLYPTHTKVFGVALFSEFTWSPSYGFGVVFFLGLLILFRTRFMGTGVDGARSPSVGSVNLKAVGALMLFGILVLGGSAMKTPAVAAFVGGLGLFWLWRLLTGRLDRLLSLALAVSLVGLLAIYLLMLSGSSTPASGETELAPLNFLKYTVFASALRTHPGLVPLIGAAVVMCLWKVLPVVGAVWPLSRRGVWSPYTSLALAMFVFGSAVYVIMGSPNDNETYFIWFGYIAVIPVAAVSSRYVWRDMPGDARMAIIRVCVLTLALGLAIAGTTQVLNSSGTLAGSRRVLWYAGTLGLVGGVVLLWSSRLERHLAQMASMRRVRVAICGVLLLMVLGCAESLTLAAPQAWRTILDRQAVPQDSKSHPGMSAALYRGLVWVREHTNVCDILAANTHELVRANGRGAEADPGYFYYSAFTERRVLLEGWISTAKGQHGEQPYPALYALNNAATSGGSPAAVRELARKGVSYILIDKTHGGTVRESASVSRLVFDSSALALYRVTVPVARHGC
jgi:hypothetical protein